MAQNWLAKSASEVVMRSWTVPLDADDSISTVSATGSGVTVDSTDYVLDEAQVVLSAGTNATTATVTVTVTTREGRTLIEIFKLAIRTEAPLLSYTANDICAFAMRKIVGNGEDASADELADALERLNDMIALWRIDGCDIGLGKLAATDTVAVPDEYISALKFNLRVACHDHYGQPNSAYDNNMATMGKRLIENRLFQPADIAMPGTLARTVDHVSDLF